eukprot:SAG11_NODE_787_length_7169_cov_4.571146_1_plen_150_part_00
MTPVGRVGLPTAVLAAVEGWLAVVGRRRDVHRCTKGDRPWQRCMVCGPLFPRLGGFPAGVSRTPCAKGMVTAELRAMLALVPSVAGELSRYSAISLRKGGSSAAAAAGIADHVRQRVGRWRGAAAMQRSYTLVSREELAGATAALFAAL